MQIQEQIANEALKSLKSQGKVATPAVYREFFCKLAKHHNIMLDDCVFHADPILSQLNDNVRKKLPQKDYHTPEELIRYMVDVLNLSDAGSAKIDISVHKKGAMTQKQLPYQYLPLLLEALSPSLSDKISDQIRQMKQRLHQQPEIVSQKEIEREVDHLIEERIMFDKEEVGGYAQELSGFLDQVMSKLGGVVSTSDGGSKSLGKIRQTLDKFKSQEFTGKHLLAIRDKLAQIAHSMEKELDHAKHEIEDRQGEVEKLKGRVKDLEERLDRAEMESKEDFLTKVMTKRGLNEELLRIEESYRRHGFKYALVFLDIDHFKKINDTYGHDAGDKVLAGFAKKLKDNIRKVDTVGRYGGEEFVVVLSGEMLEGAQHFAEKVRHKTESLRLSYKSEEIRLTVSGGAAGREEVEGVDALLELADSRLYQAKENGRNQIKP